MGLLAYCAYDPLGGAVTKATTSLLAMTAMDTSNLRCTFNAPPSGKVMVRMAIPQHGSTTFGVPLLGVLDGASIVGRVHPMGGLKATAVATHFLTHEACFAKTGLTPNQQYNWDMAYAVQVVAGAGGLKYGGPDNATANNAFGAAMFEVWAAPNLLGSILYDPLGGVVTWGTAASAMAAFDTSNLRITFTAPASGKIMWRVMAVVHGTTTYSTILLGILEGSTLRARQAPVGCLKLAAAATTPAVQEARGCITGLTPGNSYSYDAAWGIETFVATSLIKCGGPDNNSGNNAFGAVAYEIWAIAS